MQSTPRSHVAAARKVKSCSSRAITRAHKLSCSMHLLTLIFHALILPHSHPEFHLQFVDLIFCNPIRVQHLCRPSIKCEIRHIQHIRCRRIAPPTLNIALQPHRHASAIIHLFGPCSLHTSLQPMSVGWSLGSMGAGRYARWGCCCGKSLYCCHYHCILAAICCYFSSTPEHW